MEHTIYLEATVRARLDDVCDVLAKRTTHGDHPDHLQVELGSGAAIRQPVAVVSGPVEVQGSSLAQPIHIEAVDHPELFPTLDGDLFALTRRSTGETRICLTGRYQPPLGPAGAIGHRLGGRRLAEESIRGFFDELVSGINRGLETMQVGFRPPRLRGRSGTRTEREDRWPRPTHVQRSRFSHAKSAFDFSPPKRSAASQSSSDTSRSSCR